MQCLPFLSHRISFSFSERSFALKLYRVHHVFLSAWLSLESISIKTSLLPYCSSHARWAKGARYRSMVIREIYPKATDRNSTLLQVTYWYGYCKTHMQQQQRRLGRMRSALPLATKKLYFQQWNNLFPSNRALDPESFLYNPVNSLCFLRCRWMANQVEILHGIPSRVEFVSILSNTLLRCLSVEQAGCKCGAS